MKKILGLMIILVGLSSCMDDSYGTQNNYTSTNEGFAYLFATDPSSADAFAVSNYIKMYEYGGNHDEQGQKTYDLGTDLMTEDMVQVVHHWFGWYYLLDNRLQNYRSVNHFWREWLYPIVTNSNYVLRRVDLNTTNTSLKQIIGQLYAQRGYAYLYLARIFQKAYAVDSTLMGVPIFDETIANDRPTRNTIQMVYDQVINDLTKGNLYLTGYVRPNKERIDKSVIAGLLARAYMDTEDWTNAATWANTARQGYPLMTQTQYESGFSNIAIPEVMWATDVNSENTNFYASYFSQISNIDPGYCGALGVYKLIDKQLYNQIPASDYRKSLFDGTLAGLPAYANLKFYSGQSDFSGDLIYMRSAEMYLIEAEAKAKLGQADAGTVLESVVTPKNPSFVAATGTALLDQIYLQRRIELWGEGFALNDIKRRDIGINRNYAGTNHRSDARFVVAAQDPKFVFQIPLYEIDVNPYIIPTDQNP